MSMSILQGRMIQRGRIGVKRTANARFGPDAVSTLRQLRPFASGNATCDLGPTANRPLLAHPTRKADTKVLATKVWD
jgi:hypothetical protein